VRAALKAAVQLHLLDAEPAQQTHNTFRLRRPSVHADYEFRTGSWRVFYRIEAEEVVVLLIGEKRGSKLIVKGEEFAL
jgi:mRNA-degrading endonuclease RelE of RelBE toxin-antitoxin system